MISYTATDDSNATCSGTVTVSVPDSQGSKGATVGSGQAVDSFGP